MVCNHVHVRTAVVWVKLDRRAVPADRLLELGEPCKERSKAHMRVERHCRAGSDNTQERPRRFEDWRHLFFSPASASPAPLWQRAGREKPAASARSYSSSALW